MSDSLSWIAGELTFLTDRGLRRQRRETAPLPGGRCQVNGKTCWNFSANDALGLAGDERLVEAAVAALKTSGVGARASALVSGRTQWHVRLESRLAQFKQAEAALLFPSGYAANLGVLAALAGPEDVVFCDRLSHASLVDGARLSRARLRVFPHGDAAALRADLARHAAFRRRVIVTESLFSMDGDVAPLAELVRLAEEFDALLFVDEAHATGLFGRRGSGLIAERLVEADGLPPAGLHRIVPVGTLSKSVGAQGGFVTGSRELIDWLWNVARTQMFSTALAAPVCAAAERALDIIEQEPHRRDWLRTASQRVVSELRAQGWPLPQSLGGPILPVLLGEPAATLEAAERLEELGVLVAAIRPPTVPRGTSRLRLSLSFAHGEEGLAALLSAMQRLASRRKRGAALVRETEPESTNAVP